VIQFCQVVKIFLPLQPFPIAVSAKVPMMMSPMHNVPNKNIIGSRLAKARKISGREITQLDLAARVTAMGVKIDRAGKVLGVIIFIMTICFISGCRSEFRIDDQWASCNWRSEAVMRWLPFPWC